MPLYQKHRPNSFDQVVGNESAIRSLQALAAKDEPPHAYLLIGPTGCGKTTLGRIMAITLGVHEDDYRELDAADFRGIETARTIRHNAHYKALRGERRAWLIDECFARGSQVQTVTGLRPIESIKVGDLVFSLSGPSRILHSFRNVVSVDRIVRLNLSNGKSIYSTLDHLFRTIDSKWVHAGDLVAGSLLLPFEDHIMASIDFRLADKHAKDLPSMQGGIQTLQIAYKVLFKALCKQSVSLSKENLLSNPVLRYLWKISGIPTELKVQCSDLRKSVWQHASSKIKNWAKEIGRDTACVEQGSEGSSGPFKPQRSKTAQAAFAANESEQSISYTWGIRKSKSNEIVEGVVACLERRTGWEWEANYSSEDVVLSAGVANGGCDLYWSQSAVKQWLPIKLQSRYWQFRSKTGNRSRRWWSSSQECNSARPQEGRQVKAIRVESVEVYKRGYNDKSFEGVIDDRERNQGFAIFYDLEVENDPSYFVEGVAVHNCHKLTNDAQNALLKGLEDPPPHCYYILCTTDPDKLLDTIRGRCSIHSVKPLTVQQMVGLLGKVSAKEKAPLSRKVLNAIALKAAIQIGDKEDSAECYPRDALQILEQVIVASPEDQLKIVEEASDLVASADKLVNELLKKASWMAITNILKDVKDDDVERLRRGVLGYCNGVMMRGSNEIAAEIIFHFKTPFFDSGMAGLTLACFAVLKG